MLRFVTCCDGFLFFAGMCELAKADAKKDTKEIERHCEFAVRTLFDVQSSR